MRTIAESMALYEQGHMSMGEALFGTPKPLHYAVPGVHCDNCAGTLPSAYIEASVYGVPVLVCSGWCVARLLQVWAPVRRRFPLVQIVALCVSMALLSWR